MTPARRLSLLLLVGSICGVWIVVFGLPRLRIGIGAVLPPVLPPVLPDVAQPDTLRFAAIGDYGMGNQAESDVAALVKSWSPSFVITLGDNNYPSGAAATIDEHIGKDYAEFIFPYTGVYTSTATANRFFPALGNHDWISITCKGDDCTGPYHDYFTLPGNERYYDFVRGPVHFFAIDSDPNEPDGRDAHSAQAEWLRRGLAASTAVWKIVYMHHTIYSSSLHGSEPTLQWPYREWGAHAVLTGHDHTYERVMIDGFPYFVNGLGGAGIRGFGAPVPGSVVRYNGDHGAQLIEADEQTLRFRLINRAGQVIDDFTIDRATLPTPTPTPQATALLEPVADAFVDAGVPDTNYGSAPLLEIDGSPEKVAYLRFDLSKLAGAKLRGASLRLRVADVSNAASSSSQTIHLTDGRGWDESTLVFTNRPLPVGDGLGNLSGGAQGQWIVAPLGAALESRLGQSVTLAIGSTGSDGLDVYAREGSHPPQLLLAYDQPQATATPTETPTVTPTATGTATPTPTPSPTPSLTGTATATPTPNRSPTPSSTRPPDGPPDAGLFLPRVNR